VKKNFFVKRGWQKSRLPFFAAFFKLGKKNSECKLTSSVP
jgi:hypothetical protein